MNPTLEIYRQLKNSDESLSQTAISNRTGRHPETIQDVLKGLDEIGVLEKTKTNNTTYFGVKNAASTVMS